MAILVVEDEPLLAIEIQDILTTAGFDVVGPIGNVKDALAAISGSVDAAVLDVNLGRETSERVAEELARRDVRFLAISGYASHQRPTSLASAPFLAKPFRAAELVAQVRKLLAGP